MTKNLKIPSVEVIRKAYIEELSKRNPNAEAFANFTEVDLGNFIRKYVSSNFTSIYENTDHRFYDSVRNRIANDEKMRAEDDAIEHQYSFHLGRYSSFLESKAFQKLFSQKINIEGDVKAPKTSTHSTSATTKPHEREMTEGERRHVEQEREVVKRNPSLRQTCIDKYGYQCQCCGMNFAELYGEELGDRFIEVHHLKMISTYNESLPDDYVENLVPLCSNCHSMIHHGKEGPLTLRELRTAYRGEKKSIKVWKED